MNQMIKKSSWMTMLVLAGLASFSLAQDMPGTRAGRGAFGFASALEKKVGLSAQQRDAVRGLLADQRLKSQALRQETDTKIRGLLNAEQQKKFDAMKAEQKARFQKKS
jgi:hypothetical protein